MAQKLVITLMVVYFLMVDAKADTTIGNFNREFDITWGDGRGKTLNNGQLLTLSLDKVSGSGFKSKNQYLFGKIDMQLKLVPGNSAGTVTSFYVRYFALFTKKYLTKKVRNKLGKRLTKVSVWQLSSLGSTHDEIDFEFLGNLSGDPYILHTNVFVQGKGNREQQFYLWFDPTKDFHTYSILWNPETIIFFVDQTPIRQFKNLESYNVPFPNKQPMWIFSSLWDAEDWATRGGLVKTDWTQAPFTASYRNFGAQVCQKSPSCSNESWITESLDSSSEEKMKSVQKNYMIYNYCSDAKRFPQGFPVECEYT